MDYQARIEAKALTFVSNISSVIAAKAGKGYKVIAQMKDGSEVVLKKSGNLKPFVNVFDFACNGNAPIDTAAEFCTFNNKAGVLANKQTWDETTGYDILRVAPIASFQVTEAA